MSLYISFGLPLCCYYSYLKVTKHCNQGNFFKQGEANIKGTLCETPILLCVLTPEIYNTRLAISVICLGNNKKNPVAKGLFSHRTVAVFLDCTCPVPTSFCRPLLQPVLKIVDNKLVVACLVLLSTEDGP